MVFLFAGAYRDQRTRIEIAEDRANEAQDELWLLQTDLD